MNKTRNTKQPLVSVIMPVYNAENFLTEAIESILQQSYSNFEFIIIDDASSDNSWNIIQKYAKKYTKKIQAYRMPKNLNRGGDTCANEALVYAKGKYIARMDADDVAHYNRLEKQVAFLEDNTGYFLVGSNAEVIDQNGKSMGDKLEPETYDDIYSSYFTFHPLIHPTVMFHRTVDGTPFKYRIKYSANNDYYTFFTLLCKNRYKFANLQERLLLYRIHGKNDTFNHMKEKFLNTLKIRGEMVFQYGYPLNFKQVLITIAQAMILLLLPEKMVTTLYLFAKGIVKPVNPILGFKLRVKNYFTSPSTFYLK